MIELLKRYAIWIVFSIVVIFSVVFINNDNHVSESAADEMQAIVTPSSSQTKIEMEESDSGKIIVDIKGEVKVPGVYEMEPHHRIHHVIEAAGGFTEKAEQTQVNLAQRVQDEMVILVPKAGELESLVSSASVQESEGGVRINYATKEEIENLNGIGPSKAEAIIKYREENGHFQSPEDLLEVSGIGEKTLENLRDQLIIP